MRTFFTDPFVYSKQLEQLGNPSNNVVHDRVFEFTYDNIDANKEAIIASIEYKPCEVTLTGLKNEQPLKKQAKISEALTMELEHLLNMKLNTFYCYISGGIASWTDKNTGDPLLLSPKQQAALDLKWDIKGLTYFYPIGSEEWIPWLIISSSSSVENPIPYVRWKDIYLVKDESIQTSMIIKKASLLQMYVFVLETSQWKKMSNGWPIMKLADLSKEHILVKGDSTYNAIWFQQIKSSPVPFIYQQPESGLSDAILQLKLFYAASLVSKSNKVLPIFDSSIKLVKVYTESTEALDNFNKVYSSISFSDLHITDSKSNFNYRIPVLYQDVIYISDSSKSSKGLKTNAFLKNNILDHWSQLRALYDWMGL